MGRDRSRSRDRSHSRGRHSPRRSHHSREASPQRGDRRSDHHHSREQPARRRDNSQERHRSRDHSRERNLERHRDRSSPRRGGGGGGRDDRRRERSPYRDRRDEDRRVERSPHRHHDRGPDDRQRQGRWRDEQPPIKREQGANGDGVQREDAHGDRRHSSDRSHHHREDSRDFPPPPPREPRDGDGGRGRGRGRGGGGRGRRDDRDDRGPGGKEVWGRPEDVVEEKPPVVVVQPIMELSGKLAQETNKVNGVVLKHQPPPDAAKPDKRWRLYIFKGEALAEQEPLYLHRHDHCLFGRDPGVADVMCAHPSVSKQHAVIQYRRTAKPDEFGLDTWAIRPYLMDLDTVNGTFLNGERIEGQRFYELLPKDVIKFGQSSRDYVLLHEELA